MPKTTLRHACSVLVIVGLVACTTTDGPTPFVGASLIAAAPVTSPLPSPGKPVGPRPPLKLCPSAPDLSVASLDANSWGLRDRIYICSPITNAGGAAWSSNASQLGVNFTSSAGNKSASASGFASLAAGATTSKCAWVSVPGLLRQGHDQAQFGECQVTTTVASSLVFDPDIRTDGNTANDDCFPNNNRRSKSVDYMVACPW